MKQTFGQTYQNYEQQDLKILIFKAIFQHQKLMESFQKKVLVKNILLGVQLMKLMKFFENFNFLKMCPIFVGSVHNFGKSDGDII